MARDALARAGERAASLAATVEAAGVFAQAAELADDPLEEARLRERAGRSAYSGGDMEAARRELERRRSSTRQRGRRVKRRSWRRCSRTPNGSSTRPTGRWSGSRRPTPCSSESEADEGFAAVAAELPARSSSWATSKRAAHGRRRARGGRAALAAGDALPGAEHGRSDHRGRGRWEQGYALIKRALEVALENDRTTAALRAYNNLGDMLDRRDRAEEAIEVQLRRARAGRKVGARANEWRLLGEIGFMYLWLGRHDEARRPSSASPSRASSRCGVRGADLPGSDRGRCCRGAAPARRDRLGRARTPTSRTGSDTWCSEAMVSNAEGRHQQALEAALPSLDARLEATSKLGWEEALVAAHALGRTDVVRDIVSRIEQMAPGQLPPTLRAHGIRFRALLGDDPDQRFLSAAAAFREYGWVPRRRWCRPSTPSGSLAEGRAEEAAALLAEARAVFERLKARPWLERCDALAVSASPSAPLAERDPGQRSRGRSARRRARSRRPSRSRDGSTSTTSAPTSSSRDGDLAAGPEQVGRGHPAGLGRPGAGRERRVEHVDVDGQEGGARRRPARARARHDLADPELADVVHEEARDPALGLPGEHVRRRASSRAGRSGRSAPGRRGPARPGGTSASRASARRRRPRVPVSVCVSKWTRPSGPWRRAQRADVRLGDRVVAAEDDRDRARGDDLRRRSPRSPRASAPGRPGSPARRRSRRRAAPRGRRRPPRGAAPAGSSRRGSRAARTASRAGRRRGRRSARRRSRRRRPRARPDPRCTAGRRR